MNKTQAAERIARAIFFTGYDSLSISEENVLATDEEFAGLVQAHVDMLERQRKLEKKPEPPRSRSAPVTYSLNLDDDKRSGHFLAQWELDGLVRQAHIWRHSGTNVVLLEIKQWTTDTFHSVAAGAHDTVYQQELEHETEDQLRSHCIAILADYGLPEDSRTGIEW